MYLPNPAPSPSRRPRVCLLVVDPQNDFHEGGPLAVPGARADATRVAHLIRERCADIESIVVTLDSHHKNHIAHGVSWINADGQHPAPFTLISAAEADKEIWKATNIERVLTFKEYARDLEAKGRFQVCIWPEHCLIGSEGHAVVKDINDAVQEWCERTQRNVHYVWKGMSLDTEMYSAMAAEVPVPTDPDTHFNDKLMVQLNAFDAVIICGQALSHCVNFTARDIISHWRGDKSGLIVLSDCSSPVGGFQEAADAFLAHCRAEGVIVTDSISLLNEWDQRCVLTDNPELASPGVFRSILSGVADVTANVPAVVTATVSNVATGVSDVATGVASVVTNAFNPLSSASASQPEPANGGVSSTSEAANREDEHKAN